MTWRSMGANRGVEGDPVLGAWESDGGDSDLEPPRELLVPSRVYATLIDHLRRVRPLEGVGLLGGVVEAGRASVSSFYPGTNADASATRYTMDPPEVLAAFRAMDANNCRLVAIVHSHPVSAPVPSATDLNEARYAEALLLIVGLGQPDPQARAWRLVRGRSGDRQRALEVPLIVERERC